MLGTVLECRTAAGIASGGIGIVFRAGNGRVNGNVAEIDEGGNQDHATNAHGANQKSGKKAEPYEHDDAKAYHCCSIAAIAPATNLATHCPHASIWSGADTCGTQCDAYCQINAVVCTGANASFGGMNECLSKCGAWATTGKAGDTSGNTIQCREYHQGVASTSDANAMTHCPHIKAASATCTM
jgi:hypothetical protein